MNNDNQLHVNICDVCRISHLASERSYRSRNRITRHQSKDISTWSWRSHGFIVTTFQHSVKWEWERVTEMDRKLS